MWLFCVYIHLVDVLGCIILYLLVQFSKFKDVSISFARFRPFSVKYEMNRWAKRSRSVTTFLSSNIVLGKVCYVNLFSPMVYLTTF